MRGDIVDRWVGQVGYFGSGNGWLPASNAAWAALIFAAALVLLGFVSSIVSFRRQNRHPVAQFLVSVFLMLFGILAGGFVLVNIERPMPEPIRLLQDSYSDVAATGESTFTIGDIECEITHTSSHRERRVQRIHVEFLCDEEPTRKPIG